MSDYTSTFTENTGDSIDTTDFSTEFDAIETAVATKYDSDDLLDEDDMASDSATKFPSQQSVKAYFDNRLLSVSFNSAGTLVTGSTGLTTSKIATGQYRITHNLGSSTSYHVMCTINGVTDRIVRIGTLSTNFCDVYTYDISGVAAVDQACHILIHVYS